MKIAVITAGGAGMFCGSCMQDNTLVRTLRLAGEDAVLVPTYTPIRVDEEDASLNKVFLGGINVYLDSAVPGWKRLPAWATGWLNGTPVLRLLTKLGTSTDAARLGSLTLDMLKGTVGPQQREVIAFTDYLCDELKPDIIVFSNALLSGVLSSLRDRFSGPIVCLLQGDDIFLDALSKRWKQPVIQQLSQNCRGFDGFLTHSQYYRDFMADYLSLPLEKFRQIPLALDVSNLPPATGQQSAVDERFTIGYFARVCPEKGIENLLSIAPEVLNRMTDTDIVIGGYLPRLHSGWFHRTLKSLQRRFGDRIRYVGSPIDRLAKYDIIRTFDVLCVPTTYREPKGLFVLEAGLLNIPAVVPGHGAFPELIAQLNSGWLFDPNDLSVAVDTLEQCRDLLPLPVTDSDSLPQRIRQQFSMEATASSLSATLAGFATSSLVD